MQRRVRKSGRFALCLAVTFGMATGGNVIAQRASPPEGVSGLRLGALLVAPSVELTNVGLDTNILRETDQPKRDVVGTAASRVDVYLQGWPFRLAVSQMVGYDHFNHYSAQRSVNRAASGRIEVPLNRLTVHATGALVNARERLNYEIDARVRRIARSSSAGLDMRVSAKTTLTAEIERSDVGFDQDATFRGVPLQATLGRRDERASGSMRVAVTPLTTAVLRSEVEWSRFGGAPIRNSNSLRIVPAVELRRSALVAGHAAIGYEAFRPLTAQFPRFSGMVGTADAALPVTSSMRARVEFARDLDYSYDERTPLYVRTGTTASLLQRIGERWELLAAAGRQRLDYRSIGAIDTAPASDQQQRTDSERSYRASINRRVSPNVSVAVDAEYARRKSGVPQRRFDTMRFSASVRYGTGR